MDTRGFRQGPQVTGVGSKDVVTIGGKTNESGIDRILSPASTQEQASLLAQLFVERPHLDGAEQTCDLGLTAGPAAPDLSNDAAVAEGGTLSYSLPFQ